MNDIVYILGGCRTPIGKYGGSLAQFRPADLGTVVIAESLHRAGVPLQSVDHVEMGCVLQAGQGQNPARQAALGAGLPIETTALTVNAVCGSGLESINRAARMILTGDADIVVAGGMECMSQAPFAAMNARFGYKIGSPSKSSPFVDTMVNDALWDAYNDCHMGITAENIAKRWNVSRRECDLYALKSHQKAVHAIKTGAFSDEIVPVPIKTKSGTVVFAEDECPRENTSPDSLSRLKPAFCEDGVVTAGNSSGLNDGAAAVVLASGRTVARLKLKPVAIWCGSAAAGVDPAVMGIGPVASTRKMLKRLDVTLSDIGLFEVNEAFAVQSIAVQRELGLPREYTNIHGGAIALGHPVGASGARILVTLLYSMIHEGIETGVAALCVGGGMGVSTMIRLK